MAGFAAAAVGFVAFAMPGELFEAIIAHSGLPALVLAAQPPLGTTARWGVVAAAAILTFGALFLILRALGRPARVKDRARETVAETPRLRRADLHPDAPPRRPRFGEADLGAPAGAIEGAARELVEEAPAQDPDESIGALMRRFEHGLSRKRRPRRREVAPTVSDFPSPPSPAGDQRLQSAIDSLQRLADRG